MTSTDFARHYYASVRHDIEALSDNIQKARAAYGRDGVPYPHQGEDFRSAAITFARESHQLESDFAGDFFAVAAQITDLCGPEWEKNLIILDLWHLLAKAKTQVSDHPDQSKRVATLNLSSNGELLECSPNRIAEGVGLEDIDHEAGQRINFRSCSEIITLAERLKLRVQIPDHNRDLPYEDRRVRTRVAIAKLSDDIVAAGNASSLFNNDYFAITVSPCKTCAPPVLQVNPKAVIVPSRGGESFSRASGIQASRELLRGKVIHFPEPPFG